MPRRLWRRAVRAWLALTDRGRVPGGLRQRARDAAAHALPANGQSRTEHSWVHPAESVGLFLWTDEESIDRDPAWVDGPAGAVAVAGHLTEIDLWPNLLPRDGSLDLESIEALFRAAGGVYSCGAVTADGQIAGWNTMVRAENVYWHAADDIVAIGSRALLTHLAGTGRPLPDYDVPSLAAFVALGYPASDRLLFIGTKLLEPDHQVTARPAGVETAPRPSDTVNPSLDDIAARLLAACEPIRRAGDVTCNLTGGRDSRLLAAALTAAGLRFRATTKGPQNHPDVVIAHRVAEALGVEHSGSPPPANEAKIDVDPLELTRLALRASDGELSGRNNVPGPGAGFRRTAAANGVGGELLRGGYVKAARTDELGDPRLFVRRRWLAHASLLRPEIRRAYEPEIAQLHAPRPGESGAGVLDRIYLRYRIARWAAPSRGASTALSRLFQPLFDDRLIRAARAFDEDQRFDERLTFDLIRYLAPTIVDLPINGVRWRFERGGPTPGREAGWAARAAIPVSLTAGGVVDWRRTQGGPLDRVFRERLLDESASAPLAELVDRGAVSALLGASRWAPGLNVRRAADAEALWSLLAVATLLSNEWLSTDSTPRPVTIRIRPSVTDRLLSRLLPLAVRAKAFVRSRR